VVAVLICALRELLLALAVLAVAVLDKLAHLTQHLELQTQVVAVAVLLMILALPISLIQAQAALAL
jgi:hypothetical protein